MTAIMIVSAVIALGLLHLRRLAFPAAPPLVEQAARWERERARAGRRAETAEDDRSWSKSAAEWVAEQLRNRRPDDLRTYERDLAVTGQSMEEWLAHLLVWFLIGLLAPAAAVAVFNAAGLSIPMLAGPVLGLVFGIVAVVAEARELKTDAAAKREELRDALADFMDLVVMAMEGGSDHADALPAVAAKGTGWAFHTLHDTIDNARANSMTPWQALGEVGETYGVVELIDLRAALNLAREDGTSIHDTLIERAKSMRQSRLHEAEERAARSTDAMRNTLMVMALVGAAYVILARILFLFTA